MTVSTKIQTTQAKVLFGLQQRSHALLPSMTTSAYLGRLLGLSRQQVAAAFALLEAKGLVRRARERGARRWYLTTEGHNAEVK